MVAGIASAETAKRAPERRRSPLRVQLSARRGSERGSGSRLHLDLILERAVVALHLVEVRDPLHVPPKA